MKRSYLSLLAATAFMFALSPQHIVHADDNKPLTKEDVEAIVKKVIKENPQLIDSTMRDYEENEAAEKISKAARNLISMQDKIAHDPNSPSIGNPNGDVTVVEFFDYHCGYCKRFYPEIAQLLHEDKNVRVVFKEFPILSPDSSEAAKAALAVYKLDKSKYFDYHIRLMQTNNEFTEEVLTAAAQQEGLDADAFRKAFADPDLAKDLERNKLLAKDLAVTGTPGIIIGTEFMPGAISYDKLKATVDEVRDNQNQHKTVIKRED